MHQWRSYEIGDGHSAADGPMIVADDSSGHLTFHGLSHFQSTHLWTTATLSPSVLFTTSAVQRSVAGWLV
jgi:hypothetical protein